MPITDQAVLDFVEAVQDSEKLREKISSLESELYMLRLLAEAVVDLEGGPGGKEAIHELEDYLSA